MYIVSATQIRFFKSNFAKISTQTLVKLSCIAVWKRTVCKEALGPQLCNAWILSWLLVPYQCSHPGVAKSIVRVVHLLLRTSNILKLTCPWKREKILYLCVYFQMIAAEIESLQTYHYFISENLDPSKGFTKC